MSLKTWVKEFYPVEASAMADKSDVKCIEHSLRKWEGRSRRTPRSTRLSMWITRYGKPAMTASV